MSTSPNEPSPSEPPADGEPLLEWMNRRVSEAELAALQAAIKRAEAERFRLRHHLGTGSVTAVPRDLPSRQEK